MFDDSLVNEASMINVLIITLIVVAIFLGYKTKLNTGLYSIVFAYIVGTFVLGLKPTDVIKMWPISIFFVILSISLFYNLAISNGTLEVLAQHMLYRTRHYPAMLPLAIFIAATILAALGAGFFAVMAFFGPITMILCRRLQISPLVGALAVNYGALCGNNFMISPGGVVFIGLMNQAGYEAVSYMNEITIFLASFIIPLIVLSLMIFLGCRQRGDRGLLEVSIQKPSAFNSIQKKTLSLICCMIVAVLIVPLLKSIIPDVHILKVLNGYVDVGLMAIVFAVIGLLLKLGNEKDIIKQVPWGTLLMICGVGMLIAVAIKAGTIKMIASWVTGSVPAPVVPIMMGLVGGFMSFFSSTMGVVTPALFPLVPVLSQNTGIGADVLFSTIVIGAQATAISPFSSGGSLMLSAVNESEREQMFKDLLMKGVPICYAASIVYAVVVMLLL